MPVYNDSSRSGGTQPLPKISKVAVPGVEREVLLTSDQANFPAHQRNPIGDLEKTYFRLAELNWENLNVSQFSGLLLDFRNEALNGLSQDLNSSARHAAMNYLSNLEEIFQEHYLYMLPENLKAWKVTCDALKCYVLFTSKSAKLSMQADYTFIQMNEFLESHVQSTGLETCDEYVTALKKLKKHVHMTTQDLDLPAAVHLRVSQDLWHTLQNYYMQYADFREAYIESLSKELERSQKYCQILRTQLAQAKGKEEAELLYSKYVQASDYLQGLKKTWEPLAEATTRVAEAFSDLDGYYSNLSDLHGEYCKVQQVGRKLSGEIKGLAADFPALYKKHKEVYAKELILGQDLPSLLERSFSVSRDKVQEIRLAGLESDREAVLLDRECYLPIVPEEADVEEGVEESGKWSPAIKAAKFALCYWLALDGLSVVNRTCNALALGDTEEYRHFEARCKYAQGKVLGDQIKTLNEEANRVTALLGEKGLDALRSEEDPFAAGKLVKTLAKKNGPRFQESVERVLNRYPEVQGRLNKEQMQGVHDEYVKTYLKTVGPYAHLSFSDWWSTFTTEQGLSPKYKYDSKSAPQVLNSQVFYNRAGHEGELLVSTGEELDSLSVSLSLLADGDVATLGPRFHNGYFDGQCEEYYGRVLALRTQVNDFLAIRGELSSDQEQAFNDLLQGTGSLKSEIAGFEREVSELLSVTLLLKEGKESLAKIKKQAWDVRRSVGRSHYSDQEKAEDYEAFKKITQVLSTYEQRLKSLDGQWSSGDFEKDTEIKQVFSEIQSSVVSIEKVRKRVEERENRYLSALEKFGVPEDLNTLSTASEVFNDQPEQAGLLNAFDADSDRNSPQDLELSLELITDYFTRLEGAESDLVQKRLAPSRALIQFLSSNSDLTQKGLDVFLKDLAKKHPDFRLFVPAFSSPMLLTYKPFINRNPNEGMIKCFFGIPGERGRELSMACGGKECMRLPVYKGTVSSEEFLFWIKNGRGSHALMSPSKPGRMWELGKGSSPIQFILRVLFDAEIEKERDSSPLSPLKEDSLVIEHSWSLMWGFFDAHKELLQEGQKRMMCQQLLEMRDRYLGDDFFQSESIQSILADLEALEKELNAPKLSEQASVSDIKWEVSCEPVKGSEIVRFDTHVDGWENLELATIPSTLKSWPNNPQEVVSYLEKQLNEMRSLSSDDLYVRMEELIESMPSPSVNGEKNPYWTDLGEKGRWEIFEVLQSLIEGFYSFVSESRSPRMDLLQLKLHAVTQSIYYHSEDYLKYGFPVDTAWAKSCSDERFETRDLSCRNHHFYPLVSGHVWGQLTYDPYLDEILSQARKASHMDEGTWNYDHLNFFENNYSVEKSRQRKEVSLWNMVPYNQEGAVIDSQHGDDALMELMSQALQSVDEQVRSRVWYSSEYRQYVLEDLGKASPSHSLKILGIALFSDIFIQAGLWAQPFQFGYGNKLRIAQALLIASWMLVEDAVFNFDLSLDGVTESIQDRFNQIQQMSNSGQSPFDFTDATLNAGWFLRLAAPIFSLLSIVTGLAAPRGHYDVNTPETYKKILAWTLVSILYSAIWKLPKTLFPNWIAGASYGEIGKIYSSKELVWREFQRAESSNDPHKFNVQLPEYWQEMKKLEEKANTFSQGLFEEPLQVYRSNELLAIDSFFNTDTSGQYDLVRHQFPRGNVLRTRGYSQERVLEQGLFEHENLQLLQTMAYFSSDLGREALKTQRGKELFKYGMFSGARLLESLRTEEADNFLSQLDRLFEKGFDHAIQSKDVELERFLVHELVKVMEYVDFARQETPSLPSLTLDVQKMISDRVFSSDLSLEEKNLFAREAVLLFGNRRGDLSFEETELLIAGQVVCATFEKEPVWASKGEAERWRMAWDRGRHRGEKLWKETKDPRFLSTIAKVFGQEIPVSEWKVATNGPVLAVSGKSSVDLSALRFFSEGEIYVHEGLVRHWREYLGVILDVKAIQASAPTYELHDAYGNLYRLRMNGSSVEALQVKVGDTWWEESSERKDLDFAALGLARSSKWIPVEGNSGDYLVRDTHAQRFVYKVKQEELGFHVFQLDPFNMEETHFISTECKAWSQLFPGLKKKSSYFWSLQDVNTGESARLFFRGLSSDQKVSLEEFEVNWTRTSQGLKVPALSPTRFPGFVLDTSVTLPALSSDIQAHPFIHADGSVKVWMLKERQGVLLGEMIDYDPESRIFMPGTKAEALVLAVAHMHDPHKAAEFLRTLSLCPSHMSPEEFEWAKILHGCDRGDSTRDYHLPLRALLMVLNGTEGIDVFDRYIQWRGRGGQGLLRGEEELKVLAAVTQYIRGHLVENREEVLPLLKRTLGLATRLGDEESVDLYKDELESYLQTDLMGNGGLLLHEEEVDKQRLSFQNMNEYPVLHIQDLGLFFNVESKEKFQKSYDLSQLLIQESEHTEDALTYRKLHSLYEDLDVYASEAEYVYEFNDEPHKVLEAISKMYSPQLDQEVQAQAALEYMVDGLIPDAAKEDGINLDTLLIAFGGKKLQALEEAYLGLDLNKIQGALSAYLRSSRRVNRMRRTLEQVDGLFEVLSSGEGNPHDLLQKLVKTMIAHPKFSMADFPELGVMEYFSGYTLYEHQIEGIKVLLDGLKTDKGNVLELIMAAGKTAVLAPLLSVMVADGDHLSVIMAKDALIQEMQESMEKTLGQGFGRFVHRIQFSRESDVSFSALKSLHDQLEISRRLGKVLLMTPSTHNALYLKYLEMLDAEDEFSDEQIIMMRQINALFMNKRRVLVDEADSILSIEEDSNFSVGAKNTMSEWERDLSKHLVFAARKDGRIGEFIQMDLQDEGNGELFSKERYDNEIKPILADHALEYLLGLDELKGKKTSSKDEIKALKAFLMEDGDYEEGQEIFSKFPFLLKEQFALARGQINSHLRIAIQKKLGRHYGMGAEGIAIPYKNVGEPKERSNFASHHLTYDLTLFMYLAQGLPRKYFEEKIASLQQRSLKELKKGAQIESSIAYGDYLAFIGLDAEASPSLFASDVIDSVMKKVNENDELLFKHVDKEVLQDIGYFSEEIVVNSIDMPFLSNHFQGFTGTIANPSCYSHQLNIMKQKGTEGKILSLLWAKNHEDFQSIDLGHNSSVEELVSQLLKMDTLPDDMQALADPGGYFRKGDGESVAREILRQDESQRWKGVVFYDAEGHKRVLERGATDSIPFSKSQLQANERLTFYGQANCTGANVKQTPNASMLILFGDNSLQSLEQTLFRMREIDQGQSSMIVMSKDLEKLIRSALSLDNKQEVTLLEALIYLVTQEGARHGKNNVQTQMLRMQSFVKAHIVRILLDSRLSVSQAQALLKDARSLFWRNNFKTATELYTGIKTSKNACEHVEEALDVLEKDLASWIEKNPVLKSLTDLDYLMEQVRSVIMYEDLPREVQLSSGELDDIDRVSISMHETESVSENVHEHEGEHENESIQESEQEFESEKEIGHHQRKVAAQYFPWKKSPQAYLSEEKPLLPKRKYGQLLNGGFAGFSLGLSYRANDAIKHLDQMTESKQVFDKQLHLSYNFQPLVADSWQPKLFGEERNLSKWSLIDYSGSVPRLVALDSMDASWIREMFRLSTNEEAKNTQWEHLALHHLDLGLVNRGKALPAGKELMQDPQVLQLLVQFKFFQGEVEYTEQEFAALKVWRDKVGAQVLKQLFDEHILPLRPDMKELYYNGSSFAQFLRSLV